MKQLHHKLETHYQWYRSHHANQWHGHFHWSLLSIFALVVAASLSAISYSGVGYIQAQTFEPAQLVHPEINISMDAETSEGVAGQYITYVITAHNDSYVTAYHVQVSSPVSHSVELEPSSVSLGGVYDPDSRMLTWMFDEVAAGETVLPSYSVRFVK